MRCPMEWLIGIYPWSAETMEACRHCSTQRAEVAISWFYLSSIFWLLRTTLFKNISNVFLLIPEPQVQYVMDGVSTCKLVVICAGTIGGRRIPYHSVQQKLQPVRFLIDLASISLKRPHFSLRRFINPCSSFLNSNGNSIYMSICRQCMTPDYVTIHSSILSKVIICSTIKTKNKNYLKTNQMSSVFSEVF